MPSCARIKRTDDGKDNDASDKSSDAHPGVATKMTIPSVMNTLNVNIRSHDAKQFEHGLFHRVAEALQK